MKRVHDLIGKPHKTIDIENGLTQVMMQQANRTAKGSAVFFSRDPATALRHLMEKMHHWPGFDTEFT